jgi:UDP-N-acetylglucosamine--N-acetylmuramyl-(pentapeptide) pyrophosphoryl-undecaprenol N-acetylglucosamine transferase
MKCPCHVTGNPIRAAVRGEAPSVRSGELRLLVIGGSQGAMGLNSMVMEALPYLAAAGVSCFITHQAGKNDVERVRVAYQAAGARGQVTAFIEDMATAYREADLVIARAGATTIAELIAARRPAIFVPLPTAADQHQLRNAEQVAAAGGGEVLPQAEGGERLAQRIAALNADRNRIAAMGAALASLDHPDAAADVARRLIALARNRH